MDWKEFPTSPPDWNNLKVLHKNTLPARASFSNYTTVEAALSYDVNKAHNVSLNGAWNFHLANSPYEAPRGFQHPDFDASSWKTIPVPSMWQLEGFSKPQYLNKTYGFPADPPHVPVEYNETGSYIREFSLPESFAGHQIRLRFEGVDSAFHCWLNGVDVGYCQGSRNPSEFDVTEFLKAENTLCVRVYQYCDGTYIEGQDQWRLSGIFRDVNLLAFPTAHICDFHVTTDFDEAYKDALLSVDMEIEGEGQVELALYDETKARPILKESHSSTKEKRSLSLCVPVKEPKPWIAEDPVLYHLTLTFGHQVVAQKVGFRKVEMKDGLFTVNGKPLLFRGANRHEHHPKHGRAVPYEFLRKDLLLMKQSNINTIRTCHQPSDPALYDLADELGLWIIDEADLECHAWKIVENVNLSETERLLTVEEQHDIAFWRAGRWLTDNLEWKDAYLDRARQMVERDKNHPCVIMWSLGNEAFQGRNFQYMYDWVKTRDPSRPVHYEGDIDARIVDIVSTMYPPLSKIKDFAENWDGKKSLILCEFLHAMGNGPGNIMEYFDLFHKYPCLQGGCIWEWANHGLLTRTEDGTEFYGYGGDFGETLHDGTFVMDGALSSGHEPTPALWEYRKALEPVQVVDGSTYASVRIINRYDFITLDHLRCFYKIVGDRFTEQGGEILLPKVYPGQVAELAIPRIPIEKLPQNKVAYLELNFTLKREQSWATEGFEVAWSQIPVTQPRVDEEFPASLQCRPAVSVEILSETKLEILSKDANWTFDLHKGQLAEWFKGSRNVLQQGPLLSVYRAPIDNDAGILVDWEEKRIKYAHPYTRNVSWRTNESGCVEVRCVQRLAPAGLEWSLNTTTTYTFTSSKVVIHVTGKPQGRSAPKILPRLGLELALEPAFDTLTWFGRGPGESYKDKKHAQRFGQHSLTVEEMSSPERGYEVPQEYGNHTDTRWVQFSASASRTNVQATFPRQGKGFDFHASHYKAEDLEKAQHPYELKQLKRDSLRVRLDVDHHGLGSESCGPPPLPEYTLTTGPFEFTVVLE